MQGTPLNTDLFLMLQCGIQNDFQGDSCETKQGAGNSSLARNRLHLCQEGLYMTIPFWRKKLLGNMGEKE